MSDIDYDEIRRKNIAERQAVFAEFFKEIEVEKKKTKKSKSETESTRYSNDEDIENHPPKKRRRVSSKDTSEFRVQNVRLDFKKKYNTRSRAKRISENGSADSDEEKKERLVPKGRSLKVMFSWSKPFEREIEMMRMDKWDVDKELAEDEDYMIDEDEDEDDDEADDEYNNSERIGRRKVMGTVSKSAYDPSTIPSVDDITEAMLRNVAKRSSGKTYCKTSGTSCHQCRQKTMDTKTVCRSGECIGVRGQFCGPCLRGRYGEDAVTVLKDPNWACPPCRGLCNCSICRTRNGQRPTGILAPVAQEEGFTSVMDYLQATGKSDSEEELEESEKEAEKNRKEAAKDETAAEGSEGEAVEYRKKTEDKAKESEVEEEIAEEEENETL